MPIAPIKANMNPHIGFFNETSKPIIEQAKAHNNNTKPKISPVSASSKNSTKSAGKRGMSYNKYKNEKNAILINNTVIPTFFNLISHFLSFQLREPLKGLSPVEI